MAGNTDQTGSSGVEFQTEFADFLAVSKIIGNRSFWALDLCAYSLSVEFITENTLGTFSANFLKSETDGLDIDTYAVHDILSIGTSNINSHNTLSHFIKGV